VDVRNPRCYCEKAIALTEDRANEEAGGHKARLWEVPLDKKVTCSAQMKIGQIPEYQVY
jgi:hypothetical protein